MAAEQWTKAASASRTEALIKLLCAIPGRKPEFLSSPLQQVFAHWTSSSILLNRYHQIPRAVNAHARPHTAGTESIYWYSMTHFQLWWMHLLPTSNRGWTAWSPSLMNCDCCLQLKSAVFLQVKGWRASLKNRLNGVQWLLLLDVLGLSLLVNANYIPQLTEAPFTC